MKRITVPNPEKAVGTNPQGQPVMIDYGLCELPKGTEGFENGVWGFLDREVWTSTYWRDGSQEKLRVVLKVGKLFKEKRPGEKVDISNREHEIVVEAALLKGANLPPAISLTILTMICALTGAEDVNEGGD